VIIVGKQSVVEYNHNSNWD